MARGRSRRCPLATSWTHALIWYLEENPRLGFHAEQILDHPDNALFLPAIVVAETCWIVEHGRCAIPSVPDLIADVDADPRIVIVPLTRRILDLHIGLTTVGEMHDRLIVATALSLAEDGILVTLLTADQNLQGSGFVPTVW